MSIQQKIIQSKKIGFIFEVESITIPSVTDNIYFSYHGRWDGNLDNWKNISELSNEPINYSEYKRFYILNYSSSDITITWEQMDDVTCYSDSACINLPVTVDFVPIPVTFVPKDETTQSSNPYDNYSGPGTEWIGNTTSGIGWYNSETSDWVSSSYSNGSGTNSGSAAEETHGDWTGESTEADPIKKIVSIIRRKDACTVDDAMLEVHMYNGIYEGFTVRYRYAIVDVDDNIYISDYISKNIDSKDIYILDYSVKSVDQSLSLSDVSEASIEVEIIPNSQYSRSSFVSKFNTPILVPPYTQGIEPLLTLIGEDVIFLDGNNPYEDEGATYRDGGFPLAQPVVIMSTSFENNQNSTTMSYEVCGSVVVTREIFNGKVNNDGDELVFEQGQYSKIEYTEVEYIVKPKDSIVFNYDHYQISLVNENGTVIETYQLDSNVTSSVELLSDTRRYTIEFFIGQTKLEMINPILISGSPSYLPYSFSLYATIKNNYNGVVDNEHGLVYDTQNYSINFNDFIDSINIIPANGLDIPTNIEHYVTSKRINIIDNDGQLIYTETLDNPLDSFSVNQVVNVMDNTLNQNIMTIDMTVFNKNSLSHTTEDVVAVYEKYVEPTGSLRVVSDGSNVELRTIFDGIYASSGDDTDIFIDNIGGKNELMIDFNSYESNIITIEEDDVTILNHDSGGAYKIIKDNDNFTIFDKPSPILFFLSDGFNIEYKNGIPLLQIGREPFVLKTLFAIVNGSGALSALDLIVTNMLNNKEYTYVGNNVDKTFNVTLSNEIETDAILCFEASATLDNGRKNTIKMVGRII